VAQDQPSAKKGVSEDPNKTLNEQPIVEHPDSENNIRNALLLKEKMKNNTISATEMEDFLWLLKQAEVVRGLKIGIYKVNNLKEKIEKKLSKNSKKEIEPLKKNQDNATFVNPSKIISQKSDDSLEVEDNSGLTAEDEFWDDFSHEIEGMEKKTRLKLLTAFTQHSSLVMDSDLSFESKADVLKDFFEEMVDQKVSQGAILGKLKEIGRENWSEFAFSKNRAQFYNFWSYINKIKNKEERVHLACKAACFKDASDFIQVISERLDCIETPSKTEADAFKKQILPILNRVRGNEEELKALTGKILEKVIGLENSDKTIAPSIGWNEVKILLDAKDSAKDFLDQYRMMHFRKITGADESNRNSLEKEYNAIVETLNQLDDENVIIKTEEVSKMLKSLKMVSTI
jgi:hypothetical protein